MLHITIGDAIISGETPRGKCFTCSECVDRQDSCGMEARLYLSEITFKMSDKATLLQIIFLN